MRKTVSSFVILFLVLNIHFVVGQKNTYSPYSRYGIGEFYKNGISASKALGGTGIGLRLKNQINLLNPAAYSTQDTLSFLLDFGLSYSDSKYENATLQSSHKNVEFSHLVLSFPVAKWMFATAGITPFSKVGYNITGSSDNSDVDGVVANYEGSGGINRYFLGTSVKLGNLSLGANMYYLLGTLETKSYYSLPDDKEGAVYNSFITENNNEFVISDVYFGFGAQYSQKLGDDIYATVGLMYDFKNNIGAYKNTFTRTYLTNTTQSVLSEDTIVNLNRVKSAIEFPSKVGMGLSLNLKQKFVFALDYSVQNWTGYKNALVPEESSVLTKAESMNFGFQYTPNYKAVRGYLNHVNYRFGAYTAKTYMAFGNEHLTNNGISMGLGLPFLNSRSVFHVNYEYGVFGTKNNNLVKQTYHFINLSLTLHDFWFIKSKFD